ncbi:unnamed protein product [Rotaria sordida]|uniref:Uncharacterized protein n=1 Tax=Rotaria sordida TaxID=392033 RepID=A0A815FSL7_9BILA|nr:unnamed protein product [Rotaria sordida]CAF3823177.1 unnamed protein product [Rotaria sordida]
MNENRLLHDFSKYKLYCDKFVSTSARSLNQLFREKNLLLLERKAQGKPTKFEHDLLLLDYAEKNPISYL